MRPVSNTFIKLSSLTLLALSINLVGCQTFKNLTGQEDSTVVTAEKSEQAYYSDAVNSIDRKRYNQAIEDLTSLRTFYPTGQYAEQALLDTMYAQYENDNYEAAAASADQFIRLYPSNPQISYAYYVRGVANMEGSSDGLKLFRVNQAKRDTAYLRIAFANFQELINKYPSSPYAPDAAQRMIFIYNQFAENEMTAANWYIEREAYVAAVNRAKWVFQYYPLSDSMPKAIATLAYSHQQLGLTNLAQEYQTLLQINYPEWLTADGGVKIDAKRDRTWLNKITFGKLGRSGVDNTAFSASEYTGDTKTQVIRAASQLSIPADTGGAATTNANAPLTNLSTERNTGINVGLGLPESSAQQITNQGSAVSAARDAIVDPQTTNPVRRSTLPSDNVSERINLNPAELDVDVIEEELE